MLFTSSKVILRTLAIASALVSLTSASQPSPQSFDVVVYGGTAGGVIAAVAAARAGMKVALLEPGAHLGGMVSSGLGWTDYGRKEVIGGYSLEFFQRVGAKYGLPIEWHFEPHVAEAVFDDLAREANVTVRFRHRLKERTGVMKRGATIANITTENGTRFDAKVFVDASYEGDLMAQARVSYTFGREGAAQYGESLAGVRDRTPFHQFLIKKVWANANTAVPVLIPASGPGRKLLPEISPAPKGETGAADKKVQAYNFRMCFTDDPANRVPFPKPAGYTPARYELLAQFLPKATEAAGRPLTMRDVMSPDALGHNRKLDVNNSGAFSTDYIGGSWSYPEADYRTRDRIWQAHYDYVAGFFYFLAHDPRVPAQLQAEVNQWGLAKDEFADTKNWPRQLYVREARRMVGEYVMSQKDIQTDLAKPDAIGIGSYNSDSHNVQRIVNADGFAENEGDMQVPVTPYQIPYRVMLPKRAEATNLLVPTAFSASHVAYSTLRMEPQYMIIGQAAGVAAAIAIQHDRPVQDIDIKVLIEKLLSQRVVTSLSAPTAGR